MRGIVVLALVAVLAAPAFADNDPAIAKRLFNEGRALYDQGKFLEACVLFEKSYQLDPAVGTKLNLAECAERDAKPRAAWLMWISAAEEFDRQSDKRSKFARSRADALAPKLATVVVKLFKPNQQGLVVRIGGRDVIPGAQIVERLDPGTIKVTATAPNREPFEATVTAELGGKIIVDVPALKRIGGIEPEPEPETPRNRWWVATIAGGALTLVAAGGWVYASSQINRVEDELAVELKRVPFDPTKINSLNAEGSTWQTRTRIAVGVTLGSAVVTSIFLYKAISRGRTSTTTALVPILAPRVAGAQLELTW